MAALCRARSGFGVCHRIKGHVGFHATGIGRGFWFGWQRRTGKPYGYGRWRDLRDRDRRGDTLERAQAAWNG